MSFPISYLRDDFTNNVQDPPWASSALTGSATKAETGGQAVLTLPSSTIGSHLATYATSATYDITGDGFYWNIGTMVSTAVAATALFQLIIDASNQLYWRQVNNVITARTIVAGVDTQLYTAAWSSSTYKYLRIRESGGTIFFDSSLNGTTWTNRASVANPFAVTALQVQFAASCSNVASPGSLRLDDVNLVLPAPSSTWRETTADWSISNRLRSVTLASDGGKQGVVVTADTMDASRVLGGTLRYFAGPLGSSSGGYAQLTEYASLALAQASAFPIPVSGRVDLPAMVDARYMRLYHRSIDASTHNVYEFVPRRLVQADDIEAESITAINISAGAITADKIFVLSLAAITASMGALHMDGIIDITTTGGIYQGTGSFASPTTGLKVFNSGGVGKISTYNTGVEQVTFDTDGKLKAGAGAVQLDANGVGITGPTFSWSLTNLTPVTIPRVNTLQWSKTSGSQAASIAGSNSAQLLLLADQITLAVPLTSTVSVGIDIGSSGVTIENGNFIVRGDNLGSADFEVTTALSASNSSTYARGGLNVGSATGATVGQVISSDAHITAISDAGTTNVPVGLNLKHTSSGTPAAGFGVSQKTQLKSSTTADQDASQVNTIWATATHASRAARVEHYIYDSGGARLFLAGEASGTAAKIGFLGAAPVVRQLGGATTAGATYGANEQAMLDRVYQMARTTGLLT